MTPDSSQISQGDELTFSAIMQAMIKGGWILILGTIISIGLTVLYLSSAEKQYEATMKVSPVSDELSSESSMPNISGLAALSLGSVGGEGGERFSKLEALLTSALLADRMIERYDLLKQVFHRQYNADTGKWLEPSGWLADIKQLIKPVIGLPPWAPPGRLDLRKQLRERVRVESNSVSLFSQSQIRTITFRDEEPSRASRVLGQLVAEADAILRERGRAKLQGNIAYVKKELERVGTSSYRQTLLNILAKQEQELMLIRPDVPYAFEIIDPPAAERSPVKPNAKLLLALAVILGMTLFGGLGLVYGLRQGSRRHPPGWQGASERIDPLSAPVSLERVAEHDPPLENMGR